MGDISKRGKGVVRVRAQGGGPMSTARRDMTHGYYQPDMGMRGGQMFRGGGVVKKKGSVGVALKDGGKAAFVVLKSNEMASILIETSYLSNPGDEKFLINPINQQKIAEAILKGIKNYTAESRKGVVRIN